MAVPARTGNFTPHYHRGGPFVEEIRAGGEPWLVQGFAAHAIGNLSLTRGHDKMLPGCIRAIPSCSVQIVGQTGMATANKARQFKIDWGYGDVGLFHWYFA